ncbi:MAG: NOP5/NOP56 family protein [Candidatus Diapherotrites archaeon]
MNKEQIRKKLIQATKKKIQEKYSEHDIHIIKAIRILEDLDNTTNLLIEQIKEWYSVHFPEMQELIQDNDKYIETLINTGNKQNFSITKTEKTIGKETATKLDKTKKESMGAKITDKDINTILSLAKTCKNLREERNKLAKYIEETMKEELPNFTAISGPMIGAKMLAKAGSKKKLAYMPASRIQTLGAEKALFLHIKKGKKPPKYGYLYQHPTIQAQKPNKKGKTARKLAGKLAIAAKKDYFNQQQKK